MVASPALVNRPPEHPAEPQKGAAALAAGDVIAGKYRLDRVIGRGGMGSVWAARHAQLDMPVALKFIDPVADAPEARARFEREARAAGQLRSPHVVQILDHGIDGDRPYIAMELLEGEDLGERLRREGRLSVAAAARILTQAAKALRRAHEAGIIHRDLKPSNIFLARFDDDEVVKLLDFGVAKLHVSGAIEGGNQFTQTGVVFGSPSYMSPEQARGVRVLDHRSDLWSLAVILFRAITGVKPFSASSIGDLVIKLCIDPLPVPSSIAPDLPRGVDAFFARAFERDPEKRFATAVEMAAAFEASFGASPSAEPASVAPRPPSTPPAAEPRRPSSPSPSFGVIVSPVATAPLPSMPVASVPVASMPVASMPVANNPPASAPVASAPVAFQAPISGGSGPHVAFAPGTLTPPSGGMPAVPSDLTPPSGGWGQVPSSTGPYAMGHVSQPSAPAFDATTPPGPGLAPAIPPPPLMPAQVGPAPAATAPAFHPRPAPASASAGPAATRAIAIGVGVAAVAAVILLAVIVGVLRRAPAPEGAASAPQAAEGASAPASQALDSAPKEPAPPAATAEASAAPEPAASASAEPPSAAEAPASADASAKSPPKQGGKPGKRRTPNFGY